MMLNSTPFASRKITETAVKWFLKMKTADADHPERGKFEAWLLMHPNHAHEYHAVADLWEDFDKKSSLESLANAVEQQQFVRKTETSKKRRKMAGQFVGLMFAGLLGYLGVSGYQQWQAQPVMHLAQHTTPGEQLNQPLEDGSSLFINGDSDLEVTYYRDKRYVKLHRGEVIFEVAKDKERPFIVDSGFAKVTVLGTRFAVNRLDQYVRVSVDHGHVRVESVNQQYPQRAIELRDGQVAEVEPLAIKPVMLPIHASNLMSFQTGILRFENANLEEIAQTLSRYRKPVVKAEVTGALNPHVTAVVKVNDIEQFIAHLPQITYVQVVHKSEETRLIAKAGSTKN